MDELENMSREDLLRGISFLRSEIALREESRQALFAERAALRDQIAVALAVLREVEWVERSMSAYAGCLVCGRDQHDGHAPDCRLDAALAGTSRITFSGGTLSIGGKIIGPVTDVKIRHDGE